MYTLNHIEIEGLEYVILSNPKTKSELSICLNHGARINYLRFKNAEVISEIDPSTYKDNYASSILFPFANRIKEGSYNFNSAEYKLPCNEVDKNNALHGLVYNKHFKIEKQDLTTNNATVILSYEEESRYLGFPYKYQIEITCTLNSKGISLSIEVLNLDTKSFPFTLGWHPYFTSSDLYNSTLQFKAKKHFLQDNQNITSGEEDFNEVMPFQIKDKQLDDAYSLETNTIEFNTPAYHLNIKSSAQINFLQLYTPENRHLIAVEPMTGIADSFNNKIGLQTLKPNENYKLDLDMKIKVLLDSIV